MNISEDKLNSFLKQFRLLKEKHDAVAAATGERFNIFSVLDRERDEVRTHSRFLAELLNPKGLHSQGDVFLQLFFDMLRGDEELPCDAQKLPTENLDDFVVTTEEHAGDLGQIDISIEGAGKYIVIENKIDAGDQKRQLGRYFDHAKKKVGEKNVVVIYLTRMESEPGDYTLHGDQNEKDPQRYIEKEDVLCISYSEHVIRWLDDCIKEVARIAHVRETIFQYQSLLKKLTNQSISRESAMAYNTLFHANYDLIRALEGPLRAFKLDVHLKLWVDLKSKILESKVANEFVKAEKLCYVAWHNASGAYGLCNESGLKWVIKKRYGAYRTPDKHKLFHGLAFRVKKIDDEHDLYFSVVYDGKIFYSFPIVKNDGAFVRTSDEFSKCKKQVKKINGWHPASSKSDDWFLLGHKYSAVDGFTFTPAHNLHFFYQMGSESDRQAFIDAVAKEADELLATFRENEE